MPLPAIDCPPDTPPEVCCNTFSLIGDRIRTVAFQAVMKCIGPDCCETPYRSYLTFGPRIEDIAGDSLIVTMIDATQHQVTRNGRVMATPATRTQWLVELRENGWPAAHRNRTNMIEVPDSAIIDAKARHALGHGESMWSALVRGAAQQNYPTGGLFPGPKNRHILGVAVSAYRPLPPQTTQVVSQVAVTVDFANSSGS